MMKLMLMAILLPVGLANSVLSSSVPISIENVNMLTFLKLCIPKFYVITAINNQSQSFFKLLRQKSPEDSHVSENLLITALKPETPSINVKELSLYRKLFCKETLKKKKSVQ